LGILIVKTLASQRHSQILVPASLFRWIQKLDLIICWKVFAFPSIICHRSHLLILWRSYHNERDAVFTPVLFWISCCA
jgi:hypothetical protein